MRTLAHKPFVYTVNPILQVLSKRVLLPGKCSAFYLVAGTGSAREENFAAGRNKRYWNRRTYGRP